jgi:hypothetical protein
MANNKKLSIAHGSGDFTTQTVVWRGILDRDANFKLWGADISKNQSFQRTVDSYSINALGQELLL